MFKLIILLGLFVVLVVFWQDISPYFQSITQGIDKFMLETNGLFDKFMVLIGKEDNVLDALPMTEPQEPSSTTQ